MARKVTKTSIKKKKTNNVSPNPLGHLLFKKILQQNGFRGGISNDTKIIEAYSTDESIFCIKPQLVIQPKNKHDIEIAVKTISEQVKDFPSLSLTPRAAGTGLGGGSLTDSVVIDLCAHLDKIESVRKTKDKITITCEAGAMWRDVEKELNKYDTYLPSYPASKDICSIGGSIANNAAGPDSLRYGHCSEWIESVDVVLADGNTYTIKPLNYREFAELIKQNNFYAKIAKEVFDLISKNQSEIKKNKPKTKKNSSGYPLWSVLSDTMTNFKKGKGYFDLTKLIAGSQGTIGIIVKLTLRALPKPTDTILLNVPIFSTKDISAIINKSLKYNPVNIEIFDSLTFDLAMSNPGFFKHRLSMRDYYKVMFFMYKTYHVRFRRNFPEFIVLITFNQETKNKYTIEKISKDISTSNSVAAYTKHKSEIEMFWQIRRASYTLSKMQDPSRRPAAFLEDITVPPNQISGFLEKVMELFEKFKIVAAIHGHGGNGHFHFYPLLDFTDKKTPTLIEKMSEAFFTTATKFKGNICGEHNDGIIRTPYLDKMFSKKMIKLFEKTEAIFDPDDILNPGKKVNPRFNISENIRHNN